MDREAPGSSAPLPRSEPKVPWSRLLLWEALFQANYLLRSVSLEIWLSGRKAPVPFEELKFGETRLGVQREILARRPIPPEGRILDLGCGRGRAVFLFHFLSRAEVVGVDLIEPFLITGRKLADKLQIDHAVSFEWGDMREFPLDGYSLIYACAACLGRESRQIMAERLASQADPETVLATIGWRPNHPGLTVEDQFSAAFSWGRAEVYLSKVRPSDEGV